MTTIKEIISNIKAVLKDNFDIVKAEIKMVKADCFEIRLPLPGKVKSFPYCIGEDGYNVFVPISFGPDGVNLSTYLPQFERKYGLMSDHLAASLAHRGLFAKHGEEIAETCVGIHREYVTDDYIRSHIRLFITPKPDVEFVVDPWFHVLPPEGNTIVVSIDADVVFDVYGDLEAEGERETVTTSA